MKQDISFLSLLYLQNDLLQNNEEELPLDPGQEESRISAAESKLLVVIRITRANPAATTAGKDAAILLLITTTYTPNFHTQNKPEKKNRNIMEQDIQARSLVQTARSRFLSDSQIERAANRSYVHPLEQPPNKQRQQQQQTLRSLPSRRITTTSHVRCTKRQTERQKTIACSFLWIERQTVSYLFHPLDRSTDSR
jgi:hypothetical protein